MFTVKLKVTVSIDGQTEILTVEHLLKDGKKAKVSGKSQASMNKQINMKEIMSMIISMALVNSIGRQGGIFLANISVTSNLDTE